MYTHCPNCNTHFSITQEYLDIAQGKVRCGKCDYVFNALENLYNNEEDAQSPPLESAITATEEETPEQNIAEEALTEISDTALQAESDDNTFDAAVETGTQTPATEVSAEPVDIQAPFTPPLASIDIKEKMERIAASLSAATQELKNARKSVVIDSSILNPDHSNDASTENSAAQTSTQAELATEDGINTTEISAAEAEAEAERNTETANDNNAITTAEQSTTNDQPDKHTDIETLNKDTAEINTPDIASADPEQATEPLEVASEFIETEQMAPQANPEEPAKAPIETQTTEPLALEDELELVDFSQEQEIDEFVEPTTPDFNAPPVDESDIDILNSLIETQAHDDMPPDSLIEELNDINKSLSSDDLSLDDELDKTGQDIESELDNGDDILSELEQLEKEFTTETGVITQSEQDTGTVNTEHTLEPDVSPSDTEYQQVPVVEEEVVPSFLTQSNTKPASPAALFGWLFATLLMLLLLGTQYLHFNSIKLADNPDIRPLLETLCPISGCILPLRKAPEQIVTINHDVHTHPSVKDALEIQLSFKNKAIFTQEYPILEVIFSNPRGEVIASRKFSPDEYLSNNINFIAGIKPNHTEKVNLQIVDPDPKALLSFQFNYL